MRFNKNIRLELKPASLATQVAESLTNAILKGDLKGGDQLVELELQEHFGISRSPLREAFRELEKKGLVEIVPRKGAFVKKVGRKEIEENFPVRAELEGLAARMAMSNMNDRTLNEMQSLLYAMEEAVKNGDTKAFFNSHLQFHEEFIECSGNELLIGLLKSLRMQSLWHRLAFKYYMEDLEKAFEIHRIIMDLFKQPETDPEAVGGVVKDHINVALDQFLGYLEDLEH